MAVTAGNSCVVDHAIVDVRRAAPTGRLEAPGDVVVGKGTTANRHRAGRSGAYAVAECCVVVGLELQSFRKIPGERDAGEARGGNRGSPAQRDKKPIIPVSAVVCAVCNR